jgi:hypothetical protein
MSIADDVETVKRARKLGTPQEVTAFREALERTAAARDQLSDQQLGDLYRALDDQADDIDASWSLLHFLESLDPTRFIAAFVAALPDMDRDGNRDWIETVACRLLNHPQQNPMLIEEAKREPRAASVLRSVLQLTAGRGEAVSARAARAVEALAIGAG